MTTIHVTPQIVIGENELEERFIQAMTASGGNPSVFFSRPAAAVLGIAALGVWLLPAVTAWRARRRVARS